MSQLLQFAASLTQSGHAPAAGAAGRRNRHQKHRQKICLYYEALFDMAVDEDLGGLNEDGSTTFISTATAGSKGKHRSQQQKPQSRVDWHEMFLLEVNGEHLKTLVKRHNRCPHVLFSQSMQMFLKHCATAGVQPLLSPPERTLPLESADSQTLPLGLQLTVQMLVHCLQTLEALLRAVYSLQPQAPAAFINYFTTLQLADKQFTRLAYCLSTALGHEVDRVQLAAVNLLVTIVSGADNFNANPLLQYILAIPMTTFVPLIRLPAAASTLTDAHQQPPREGTARIIAVVIGLLMNYQKYEHHNPLLAQLSDLLTSNEALLLTVNSAIILAIRSLADDVETANHSHATLAGLTKSTVGYFYSLFHHYYSGDSGGDSAPTRNAWKPHPAASALLLLYEIVHNNQEFLPAALHPPHNELGVNAVSGMITLASHLFQQSNDLRKIAYAKLLLLLFTLIVQNRNSTAALCSAETQLSLCRLRRPRLPLPPADRPTMPFVCYLLDVYLLFLQHNLRRKLQSDLYNLSLNGVGSIILHLCRSAVRLNYHWQALYGTLVNVMRFIVGHVKDLHDRPFLHQILESLIAIFNLVITHGDSFLPDTVSYDECYYEIIRNAELFMKTRVLIESARQQKRDAAADFTNIASIITNLLPKTTTQTSGDSQDNPVAASETSPPGGISREAPQSTDEVYAAIRAHYESMELKVVSRALFELRFDKSYREYPAEINYFRWLLRMSVKDLRQLALFSGGEIGDCSDFIGSSAPTSPKDFDSSAPLGSPDDRGELRRHSWERI